MVTSLLKKTLLHTMGLLGVAILAGVASGFIAGLVASDPASVAAWCARAYLALVLLLPLGLWIVVAAFFDQDRELYQRWGSALVVTVVPAVLGALAARLGFVGPATTVASVMRPRLDPAALVTAMATQFGWAIMLPVLIATAAVAILIAVWAMRQSSILPGIPSRK